MQRLFDVYAIVGVVAAAFAGAVPEGQPDYWRVLRGAEHALDDIAVELDPAEFIQAPSPPSRSRPPLAIV